MCEAQVTLRFERHLVYTSATSASATDGLTCEMVREAFLYIPYTILIIIEGDTVFLVLWVETDCNVHVFCF